MLRMPPVKLNNHGGGMPSSSSSSSSSSSTSSEPHFTITQQATAAGSYALSSICIIIFNKLILSSYKFRFPLTMTLSHMTSCLFFSVTLKSLGVISFPDFDWATARRAFPLALCFVANISMGLVALKAVNIPMFTTLRRLTLLFVALGGWVFEGKRPDRNTMISVAIMLLGSLIAGWGDLGVDLTSYAFVIINNAITACYLNYIARFTKKTQLNSFGIMFYNSLLSIPLLSVLVWGFTNEIDGLAAFPYLHDTRFQQAFAFSAVLAFFINLSIFRCTQVNSPLTTSVTGQAKNILTTVIGIVAFNVTATPLLCLGITIGLCGSIVYSRFKYIASQEQRRKQHTPASSVSSSPGGAMDRDPELGKNGGGESVGLLKQGHVHHHSGSGRHSSRGS